MRIKEIQIKGLFGMFDHKIPLNLDEHITIIYGINGIGKTMIFKILDSFFNSNFYKLIHYPFDELIIEFENNISISMTNSEKYFEINYIDKKLVEPKKFQRSKENIEKDLSIFIKNIENASPFRYLEKNLFLYLRNDEILTLDEIIEKYPSQKFLSSNNKELENIISETNLYFIETQRLLKFNFKKTITKFNTMDTGIEKVDTIKKYSDELSKIIQDAHKSYAKISEELELSLGKRLMSKEIETYSDIDELKKENKSLEDRRNELKSVGLFENITDDSLIPDTIDDLTKAVLSVNIKDMKSKIKIFDDLYDKLNIFLDILNNKRFSYKKISINLEKGFIFKNDNGKELNATELSSGEQHEIILLYELLFKVKENSLVLIDEPEISLHILWQKSFLDDLEEIVKIRNFDILVSTHSPSIINGNWDMTVELKKNIKQAS